MTDYNKLKVVELKDLLKERGIPSTGLSRKAQIVEALETNDAQAGEESVEDAPAEKESGEGDGEESVVEGDRDGTAGGKEEDAPAEEGTQEGQETSEPAEVEEAKVSEAESKESALAHVEDMAAPEPPKAEQPAPTLTATPTRLSPSAESQSSETRKRKRRSPTPPPSEDTINKKLKAAEDGLVKLPEDRVMQDAPVAVEDAGKDETKGETIVPYSTSDDVMKDAQPERPAEREERRESASRADEDISATAALHPATSSLYIRELVRPLQPQQLREHLVDLANPSTSDADPSIITTFHLDALRTHAFASFRSTSAAARARSKLHDRTWPDEPSRKALWVDFVPDEKVQEWIDSELSSGTGRRDAKRWEVVYDTTNADGVTASLEEMTAPPAPGPGMPNAPLGPRGSRNSFSQQQPPTGPRNTQPVPRKPSNTSASFDVLDQRFPSTTTKPKLYYLPLADDLVAQRIEALQSQTSRSWDDGRAMHSKDVPAAEKQLRRYTFEDGGKLVDNGPDIGTFGRGPGDGPPPPAPRGRGPPRGGYRGRW